MSIPHRYDHALVKLKDTFSVLKEKAAAMGESGEATRDKLSALEQQRLDLEDQLAELERGGHSSDGIASRGEDGDASEAEADLQESAESIRQEILRLNSEAESRSLATLLPPP